MNNGLFFNTKNGDGTMPITILSLTEEARDLYIAYEAKINESYPVTIWSKKDVLVNFLNGLKESKTEDNDLAQTKFSTSLSELAKSSKIGTNNLKNLVVLLNTCNGLSTIINSEAEEAKEDIRLQLTEQIKKQINTCKEEFKIIPNWIAFSNNIIRFCLTECGINLYELYEVSNKDWLILHDADKAITEAEAQREKTFNLLEKYIDDTTNLRKENAKLSEELIIYKNSHKKLEKLLAEYKKNYQDLENKFVTTKNQLAGLQTTQSINETLEVKKLNQEITKLKQEIYVNKIITSKSSNNSSKKVAEVASDIMQTFKLFSQDPIAMVQSNPQTNTRGLNNSK